MARGETLLIRPLTGILGYLSQKMQRSVRLSLLSRLGKNRIFDPLIGSKGHKKSRRCSRAIDKIRVGTSLSQWKIPFVTPLNSSGQASKQFSFQGEKASFRYSAAGVFTASLVRTSLEFSKLAVLPGNAEIFPMDILATRYSMEFELISFETPQ